MAPARLATLAEVHTEVWRQLQRAPRDKHHAWRTPVLATVDGAGSDARADARTVVLREVGASGQQLVVYTDARAAKVAQSVSHPHGTLVMWSPSLGWQLRCSVRLEVATGSAQNEARWQALRASPAARDYLSPLAPGAPLEAAGDEAAGDHHFAAITAHVQAIDWLELHREGHRRAVFDGAGARWVQP